MQRTAIRTDGGEQSGDGELLRTNPTTKPTLLRLAVFLLLGLAVVVALQQRPELLGGPEVTNTVGLVVLLVTVLVALRLLVRTVVLVKTTYVVTRDRVEREYQFLFRTRTKGVRFEQVRSHRLNQNRFQKALGFGTITMNLGLGSIRLENVENPDRVYNIVRECVRRA
ncbi:PH domain-containing protein [Haloarcula sp. GH36]|uniref:PH domain-containing protein n=1 Tax=Haloarcula montana TaxID=3111776 RepID=UPI002D76540A|nr:PH domain-containing protein [Haloarcula sp. GH36]